MRRIVRSERLHRYWPTADHESDEQCRPLLTHSGIDWKIQQYRQSPGDGSPGLRRLTISGRGCRCPAYDKSGDGDDDAAANADGASHADEL